MVQDDRILVKVSPLLDVVYPCLAWPYHYLERWALKINQVAGIPCELV